jgi:hypothetical protein
MKKLLRYLTVVASMLCFTQAIAADVYVDIYKTKQFDIKDIQPIIDKYRQHLLSNKKAMIASGFTKNTDYYEAFINELRQEVNKKGKFAYVEVGGVEYPNNLNEYITINVVDAADKASIPVYSPKPTGHYPDPAHLLRDWKRYNDILFPLAISGKIDTNTNHCKEFHCLAPFSTPTLKKFEVEFNTNVPKHAQALATILKDDADPVKRGNAAFLLAHTTDKKQLIAWMLPALQDSAEGVRNNATRVLAVMVDKDSTVTLPIETFIKMSHSPVLTDRNKSLAVLLGLSKQARYASIIKKEAGQDLIDNLKLIQPDLHDMAYYLLINISGQHYGERDYAAWSKWLGLA